MGGQRSAADLATGETESRRKTGRLCCSKGCGFPQGIPNEGQKAPQGKTLNEPRGQHQIGDDAAMQRRSGMKKIFLIAAWRCVCLFLQRLQKFGAVSVTTGFAS